MTRINLLPQELRRSAGTPRLLLGLVFGGVGLSVLLGLTYGYLWFKVSVVKERYAALEDRVVQLKKKGEEAEALKADIDDYKQRERTIVKIKSNRILWSRKLAQLCKLTPPEVWITSLEVGQDKENKSGEETPNKCLQLHCYALGADVKTMTDFRSRLIGQPPFWKHFIDEVIALNDFSYGFTSISQPSWEKKTLEGFRKKQNIQFSIKLDIERKGEKSPGNKTT